MLEIIFGCIILLAVISLIPLYRKGVKYAFIAAYIIGVVLFSAILACNYGGASPLYSFIFSAQLFGLGVNPKDVLEFVGKMSVPGANLIMLCFWSLFVACPFFTATVIAALVKNSLGKIMLRIKKEKDIYIFSEKNEASQALVADLLNQNPDVVAVFANTVPNKEKNKYMIINASLISIFESIGDTNRIRVCFMDEAEDKNLDNLDKFLKSARSKFADIFFFTENETDEEVIDALKSKADNVNIRVINPKIKLVQNILWDYPLYVNRVSKTELNVSVLGVGQFGGCFGANVLWCGQLPGSSLKLNLVDCDEGDNVLRRVSKNASNSFFDVETFKADIDTNSFFDTIENSRLFNSDYIMISTRDDNTNIKIARELRTFFGRRNKNPFIIAYAKSTSKFEILKSVLKDENIVLVGGINNIYSVKNIFDTWNFKRAFMVYQVIQQAYNMPATEKSFYEQTQNDIYSSYASAIHIKYKIFAAAGDTLLSSKEIENAIKDNLMTLAACEHDRWTAFEIIRGFVGIPGDVIDFLDKNYEKNPQGKPHKNMELKIHGCIMPFDELDGLAAIIKERYGLEIDLKGLDVTATSKIPDIWAVGN